MARKRWQGGGRGWRGYRRIILQLALFSTCCLSAVVIRRVVAADTTSDLATILLEFGGLVAFLSVAWGAVIAALRAASPTERVVLRLVPIGVALTIVAFVTTSYADVSVSLHALLSRGDSTRTTIVLGPEGHDIRLSGSLVEGAARELSTLLAAHPQVERIHLTSDGGLVDEGDALRKVIAAHRLTTFVPDYCVSACTLAFLGGRERLIMTGARVGFHAPFEEGLFGATFAGDKRSERATYIAAGVDAAFVDRALDIAPDDIWTPEADLLLSAHVVTGIVDKYRFPDSNLDGIASAEGARATVLRNFFLAKVLQTEDPDAVDAIAEAYLAAYRDGQSEGQVVDGLRAVLGAAALNVIARGDDDTIVGFGRLLDAAMQVAGSDSECIKIGADANLVEAEETLEGGDGKARQLVKALLGRALKTRQTLGRSQASDPPPEMAMALRHADGACAAIRGIYESALRLPRHSAARQIRALTVRSLRTAPPALELVAH